MTTDVLLQTMTDNRKPVLSSERARRNDKTVTVKQLVISDYEPQRGLDNKDDCLSVAI
jgi:hypothetical protein